MQVKSALVKYEGKHIEFTTIPEMKKGLMLFNLIATESQSRWGVAVAERD